MTEPTGPVLGAIESQKTTIVVVWDLFGTPTILKPYTSNKRYRPDQVWVTYFDGKLNHVMLTGPQIMAGDRVSPNRTSGTYRPPTGIAAVDQWGSHPDVDSWLWPLIPTTWPPPPPPSKTQDRRVKAVACPVCGKADFPEGGMHAARAVHMRDEHSDDPRTPPRWRGPSKTKETQQ